MPHERIDDSQVQLLLSHVLMTTDRRSETSGGTAAATDPTDLPDRQPALPSRAEVSFEVDGLPPLKGEAKSLLAEGHGQAGRVRTLLAAAMLAAGHDFRPWTGPIGLELRVSAPSFVGVGDATNQLGGIGDVLQERRSRLVDTAHLDHLARVALFHDDAQIAEIRYTRHDAAVARYWVRVWPL